MAVNIDMRLGQSSLSSGAPAQDLVAFGIGRLFWLTSEALVGADLTTQRIVLWNPAAERLFGYSVAEALGMSLDALVPDEMRSAHHAGIARYRSFGEPTLVGAPDAVEVPGRTKDGQTRHVALTLCDVSGGGEQRRLVLAVIRDVTAAREAERELADAHESLRGFVAAASHDLRSPLTAVIGNARLLRDHTEQLRPKQVADALAAIERSARHADRLVGDLLTLSQIRAGALPVTPAPVNVRDAALEARQRCGSNAAVTVPGSLRVLADQDHVERIVVNLLTNAHRYGAPPVVVDAAAAGTEVEIRVCDGGAGVPPELRARLFVPFAQGDQRVQGGTGLGLSIVKGLAEANGGRAFYRHSPDTSSCSFGVVLPAAGDGHEPLGRRQQAAAGG